MDLSKVVLQITVSTDASIAALRHPRNERYLLPALEIAPVSPRARREGTPLLEVQLRRAVLRTDHYPYDPARGWVFGRVDEEDDKIDVVLGTKEQGVSQPQFQINYNWQALSVVLRNLSGNGTKCIDPESGLLETILTSRVILEGEQYRISAGVIDLVLHIPPRSAKQRVEYNLNLQRLKQEVDKAVPKIGGLKLRRADTATPMFIGQQRRFSLGRCVGSGVTAVVSEAFDYETGDRFAAKQYNLDDKKVVKSMLNEIKILQKLKHEHIIQYIDIYRDPDPVLVMEFADTSLANCEIESTAECVTVLRHALAGLAFLHGRKIVHRDIKPENILRTRTDPPHWKLTDFGLSKMAELMTTFCGSGLYLAPEVSLLPYNAYTDAVDIWGLGVVGVEYSCGFGSGEMDLLQDLKDRSAWCMAVSKRSGSSPLWPYLGPMLELLPAKRPTATAMDKRMATWSPDMVLKPSATKSPSKKSESMMVFAATPSPGAGIKSISARKKPRHTLQ